MSVLVTILAVIGAITVSAVGVLVLLLVFAFLDR